MRSFSFILGFVVLQAGWSGAQESFFTNLLSEPPEKITIACNWDSLTVLKDNSSWEAIMRMYYPEDSIREWETDLTVRGKFRRAKCTFPPLEINLKKRALRARGMLEFDKLKLVTHCDAENADPVDLHEELLIYQLYGLLTPFSYRTQVLKIDYLYPNGKPFQRNATAILLEPTSELVHRTGGQELEGYGIGPDSLDAISYCRAALFQFMVGNFDWDQSMQRNVKMIGNPGAYHMVPYDFDFSAIVFPSYARLPADFGLKDFRDRVYLGQYFDAQLPAVIQEFAEKKDILLTHVSNYEHISKLRRREIIEYLEQFYTFIQDPVQTVTKGTILSYQ